MAKRWAAASCKFAASLKFWTVAAPLGTWGPKANSASPAETVVAFKRKGKFGA
jgi:hypothetical protein